MRKPLVIENARIIDPASNKDFIGAILIEDGKIADIAEGAISSTPEKAIIYNAKGLIATAGLVDTRTFTGEPGNEYRETLSSAGKAAAAGGVTSILAMPDTNPTIDESALLDYIIRRGQAESSVRILASAAITKGTEGKELTEFGLLKETGAVCFSDGRKSIQSTSTMRAAMIYATNFDMPIFHTPCDLSLMGDGVMNAGPLATFRGLKGIPVEAETIPLDRDLQLAIMTNARYHAAQVSCQRSVDLLSFYRGKSPKISAGVSINNLCLNENDVGAYRSFFKVNPPLRHENDRMAVIEAIKSGLIDTIHSDHDPQDNEQKRQPFGDAAFGAIGLETMLSAALRLYHSGDVDLMTLLRTMTINPAKILGLSSGTLARGAQADITLFDLNYPWVVEEKSIVSRSRNTTFENARMSGKVITTIVDGNIIFGEKRTA